MSEIEIQKITIRIGDKEEELTLEQAKALQDALNGLFPSQPIYVPPIYIYPYSTWPEYHKLSDRTITITC